MSAPLHLSDATFQSEVLDNDLPVLVDFWAPWCGPCKMIGPIVEEIADEYEGKIKVCKVNVDDSSQHATEFGIRSIPTLLLFKGGQAVESIIGSVPKNYITDKIGKHL